MNEYIELGPVPANEECAQTGDPDFRKKAREEGERYIKLLERTFPIRPRGCSFQLKSFPHDFGSYFEVVVNYDPNDEASSDFAYNVERELPETWEG